MKFFQVHQAANYVSWWGGVSLYICVLKQEYSPAGIKVKSTLTIDQSYMHGSSMHSGEKCGLQGPTSWVWIMDPPTVRGNPDKSLNPRDLNFLIWETNIMVSISQGYLED